MSHNVSLNACLVLLSAALLPSCSQLAKAAQERAIPVKVERVSDAQAAGPNRYSGSLEPRARVDLSFRVNGYVAELAEVRTPEGRRSIDKGDFVKKGSVLARIRASDYSHKFETSEAQVTQARAEAVLAEQDLARAKKLIAGGAITRAEYDAQVAKTDASKAQVAAALAQTREAGVALGDTVLRAPMDGVVLSRQVEVGTLASAGQLAFSIADTRTMKAVFGVPQLVVERLGVGTPVSIFVGAESEAKAPEKLLDAHVTRVAPAADSNGRVFAIEADLPNENGTLRAGAIVSVRVAEAQGSSEVLKVPLRAVIRSPRETRGFSVFVLEGEQDRAPAHLRNVQLGEVLGNDVTVKAGLAKGERVVTVGAGLLREGNDAVVIR